MPRAIAEVPVGTESATASGRTPAVHHPEAPSAVQSLNPNRKVLQAQSSKSSCELTSLRPSPEWGGAPGSESSRRRDRPGGGHSGREVGVLALTPMAISRRFLHRSLYHRRSAVRGLLHGVVECVSNALGR